MARDGQAGLRLLRIVRAADILGGDGEGLLTLSDNATVSLSDRTRKRRGGSDMATSAEPGGPMTPTVCPRHVEDTVLRRRIMAQATEPRCSYCTVDGPAPVAASWAAFVASLLVGVGVHYQPGPPDAGDAVPPAEVARDILGTAGVTHRELTDDVVEALSGTTSWVPRDRKSSNGIDQLSYSWDAFKHVVKHEMRYFFATRAAGSGDMTALQVLKAVSDLGENHPAVWPAPCPAPLFRARMATSESEASSWRHACDLGPPPPEWAAANRMSPAGISIFYGATDRATAIAEAGAHAAHRFVVTGEFRPTRQLHLIDLTNLPALPSIFDESAHTEYFVVRFLQRFIHDITLPVELDGHEHIDYVPTQVFTEYFRYAFPDRVDGLMFPSAQGPGINVVVFVGPDRCADTGAETEQTRLSLDTATLHVSRVMTVAR